MISAEAPEASIDLELRIHAVEQRLLERRQRIGRVASGIGQKVRVRTSSPGMLTAAVGFGVFLQRTRHRRTWSLLTLLNAAYMSSSLVMTLSSWLSPAPQALERDDIHQSPGS